MRERKAWDTRHRGSTTGRAAALSWAAVEYRAVLALVTLLSYTPFCVLYLLSDLLFVPFYYLVRYRRRVVRQNLSEAFPTKSHKEIVRIEKQFYHFFIDLVFETTKMLSLGKEAMQRRMKFANTEQMRAYIREGKSVAVYLGHYCNWEWIASTGLWVPESTIAQIYHRLKNKTMERLMLRLRERMGNICVERHDTIRFMAAQRDAHIPQIIGFLSDQSPKKSEAKHFLPFLNHMAPVLTGTEKAAKHFGYEAMFIAVRRVKRGYYEAAFLSLTDDPQALPDYELTRLYFQHLEAEILRDPALYLWSHKRFKFAQPFSDHH